MKLAKKLVYGLMILCMLLCAGVMICALVPGLSQKIAEALYGKNASGKSSAQPEGETAFVITGSTTAGIDFENLPFQGNLGYVIPSENSIVSPEELALKNGYKIVVPTTDEVDDTEAESIKESLGLGELGSGAQFSELYYPYYAMLTEPMKEIYCQIYANAENLTDAFQPVTDVSSEQLCTVFEAVIGDHPELFWLDTGYHCKIDRTGKVMEIDLMYYDIADRLDTARKEFEDAAEEILNGAKELSTDLEKETYLHDALIGKAEYLASADRNQSAYSALVDGKTVCAGYARAFQYLMLQLGIPCFYCTGYSGQDHAWNIVYVEQIFQNVDVTWDDTPEGSYTYFNCSDKEFYGTHMRKGLSVYLPVCPEEGAEPQPSALDGISGLINPNPIQPITLDHPGTISTEIIQPDTITSQPDTAGLRAAGLSAAEVMNSLEAYYADCEKQMIAGGSGQIEFTNAVPVSLWNSIEAAYTNGGYKTGYVENALKTLGEDNFAIHMRVVKAGDNYYKLYHMVATW